MEEQKMQLTEKQLSTELGYKGKVIDVVQTGYTLGGKVLRYAKVVVGA